MGKTIVKQGDVVEKAAKVAVGVKDTVALVAARDVYMLMLRTEQNNIKTTHTVNGALTAPVKQGDRGGILVATVGDARMEVELIAAENVDKLGWFKRALKYIGFI